MVGRKFQYSSTSKHPVWGFTSKASEYSRLGVQNIAIFDFKNDHFFAFDVYSQIRPSLACNTDVLSPPALTQPLSSMFVLCKESLR